MCDFIINVKYDYDIMISILFRVFVKIVCYKFTERFSFNEVSLLHRWTLRLCEAVIGSH